jgi:hypothetical protein
VWVAEDNWKAMRAMLARYRDLKTEKPAASLFTTEVSP